MPDGPMTYGGPELERTSQKGLIQGGHDWIPILHLLSLYWMPGSILLEFVGVCMMMVVLYAPWLEWIDERCKHESAHDILKKFVLAEGAVPTVMSNDKPAREGRACQCPSKWQGPPGGDGDQILASRHGDNGDGNGAPSFHWVELKDLLRESSDDILKSDAGWELLANLSVSQLLSNGSTFSIVELADGDSLCCSSSAGGQCRPAN